MGNGKAAITKVYPVTNPGLYLFNAILDYSAYGKKGIDALILSLSNTSENETPQDYQKLKKIILTKLRTANINKSYDQFDFYLPPALLNKILQILGLSYDHVINFDKDTDTLTLFQINVMNRLAAIERSQAETFRKLSSLKNNTKRFSTQKKLYLVLDIMNMMVFQLDGTTCMQGKKLNINYRNIPEYLFAAKGFHMANGLNEYNNLDSKKTLRTIANTLYIINNNEQNKGKVFSVPTEIALHLESKVILEQIIPTPEETRNHPFIYASVFSLYAYLDALKNYFISVSANYEANLQCFSELQNRRYEIIDFFKTVCKKISTIRSKYLELLEFLTQTASANTFSLELIDKSIENMAAVLKNVDLLFSPVNYFNASFDENPTDSEPYSFNLYENMPLFLARIEEKDNYLTILQEIYFESESFINTVKNEYGRS